MRTMKQYVDWMKLCQKLDPDCTYFVHHGYRKNRQTKVDLEEFGTTPLKLSDVERRIYVKGPEGLLELDNSILYVDGEKDPLEKVLAKVGFEVNETIEKKDSQAFFGDVPALCTRYDHNRGVVSIQFFYGNGKPILRANIKARKGASLISFYRDVEEVNSGEAELTFNSCIPLNHYGGKPFQPNQSRFEAEKAMQVGMRDNSLPLLEAIIKGRIPALLKPRGISPTLLNIP